MKIKHFAGYGSVNAKKNSVKRIGINVYGDIEKRVRIEVSGNHEWGIERDDTYDIYNWLMKRFAKDCKSYADITRMTLEPFSVKDTQGIDVDHCIYTIDYIAR